MALQVQPVDVPMTNGVDEKTDPKALPVGTLLQATNAVYAKNGAVRKRNGFTALPTGIVGGGSIAAGAKVFGYQNTLCCIDGASLYTYSPAALAWTNHGMVPEVAATRRTILHGSNTYDNTDSVLDPDAILVGGVLYTFWRDGVNTLLYMATDPTTGAVIYPATAVAGGITATLFRAFTSNGVGGLVVQNGLLISLIIFPSPTSVSLNSNIQTLKSSSSPWNVTPTTQGFVLAYVSTSGLQSTAYSMTSTSLTPLGTFTLSATTTYTAVGCTTSAPNAYILGARGTAGSSATVDLYTATTAGTSYNSFGSTTSTDPSWQALPGVVGMTLNGTNLYVTLGNAGVDGISTAMFIYSTSGASWSKPTATPVGCTSLSRPFVYNARVYQYCRVTSILGAYGNSTNAISSDVLLDITNSHAYAPTVQGASSRLVATLAPRLAGNVYSAQRGTLSTVVSLSPGVYAVATYIVTTASPNSRSGLSLSTLDFTSPLRWQTAELNDELHIAGGLPAVFDGVSVFEAGFSETPASPTLTVTTTGGILDQGTYTYVVVFEHIDARGVRHQSAPSPSASVTLGNATSKITVGLRGIRASARPYVRLIVYRTAVVGGVQTTQFYRLDDGMDTYTLLVGQGSSTNSFVDNVSSVATLGVGSITQQPTLTLTTQGGPVPNLNPPAATCIAAHRGSIWLGGTDDGRTVWYSKTATPREAISFDDAFTVSVDDTPVTALASQDATLLAFTPRRIFTQSGDVPADNGQGSSLQPLAQNQTDTGAVGPNGVLRSPQGTWFQSVQGLYLIDRGLNVTYAGKNLEDTIDNAGTTTSATLCDVQGQLRWTLGSHGFAVFDYVQGAWSTWTTPLAKTVVSSAMVAGVYYAMTSDGVVYFEDVTTSLDTGTWVTLTVSTAWVKLGSLTGFQRVRRVKMLTDRLSEHDLNVSFSNDYATSFVQTHTFTSSAFLGTTLGEYEMHVAVQKCEAMRVVLSDAAPTGGAALGTGRGFSVPVVTLLAGVKSGLHKQPATNRS